MRRRCPACESGELSVLGLATSTGVNCRSCRARIGFHWIFRAVHNFLIVPSFGIVAFLVSLDHGLAIGAAFFVIGFVALNLLAARFAPLGVKT